ncbi:ABC transporter permease [Weissella confusa]|uniref:ABC transporter permease n=1 Tax=Weissella confusa TaxID=1583 RepID=UPI0022FDFB46|nr:FtsX-like permease family protein [Weissella confusa]
MNFVKRAGITLWARKGRSVLLVLTSTVILAFVMAGLIVQNAALKAATNAANSVGSTVTLSANREEMFEQMNAAQSSESSSSDSSSSDTTTSITMPTATISEVKKIAALSNVASYNITNSASVNASSFKAITTTSTNTPMGGGDRGGMMGNQNSGDIQINGVTSTTSTASFSDGTAKIVSGRGIKTSDQNTNNVVIANELATANNIKVGDTLTVKTTDDAATEKTVKVVGIYKLKTTTDGFQREDPANTIYGSFTLANDINGTPDQASNVTFTMAEPAKTTAFVKQAKKLIDTSELTLTSDASQYKTVAASMKNVAAFASKIVWIVSIAGVLILGLIIILITRERRREIGILVSIGESKPKVVAQLFTEMLVILAIALGIATAAGNSVSGLVGKQLVQQQTTQQMQSARGGMPGDGQNGQQGGAPSGKPSGGMGGGPMMGGGAAAKNEQLDVAMTPAAIAELGGVAFLIAVLSVSGAAFSILRMRPKQILQAD